MRRDVTLLCLLPLIVDDGSKGCINNAHIYFNLLMALLRLFLSFSLSDFLCHFWLFHFLLDPSRLDPFHLFDVEREQIWAGVFYRSVDMPYAVRFYFV